MHGNHGNSKKILAHCQVFTTLILIANDREKGHCVLCEPKAGCPGRVMTFNKVNRSVYYIQCENCKSLSSLTAPALKYTSVDKCNITTV